MEEYKITTIPDNEMQCNVVSSLTDLNITLYEDPEQDNENESNLVGKDNRLCWKMDLWLDSDVAHSEYTAVNATLCEDNDYGYYESVLNICCSWLIQRFRFPKEKIPEVLQFVVGKTPNEIENFFKKLDGCDYSESKK